MSKIMVVCNGQIVVEGGEKFGKQEQESEQTRST